MAKNKLNKQKDLYDYMINNIITIIMIYNKITKKFPFKINKTIFPPGRSEIIYNKKNKVIKFCSDLNINIKLESTPRLLAFWNRPKLVWRILHDQNRTNSNITDEEIKNIELFIQFLSNYENSTKIGIIVSRNIEQALHPKSSIKLINTKFTINNEILYSSTRKFNLDKETFSIVFEG